VGATGFFRASGPIGSAVTPQAVALESSYKVLKPTQVATLEAITEQIIPADQDPSKEDFSLKPGSPAISIGFKPINLSRVGRQQSREPTCLMRRLR
jgi:hypothetical protein